MLFMGIDVGTQGVRTVVSDEHGNIKASKSIPFAKLNVSTSDGWFEQSPEVWWESCTECLREIVCQLKAGGTDSTEIRALAVDATAPTILAIDGSGRPLTNGIMYNDPRGTAYEELIHSHSSEYEKIHGFRVGGFHGVAKALWIKDNQPDIYGRAYKIINHADYIVGRLTGNFNATDAGNGLRMVCDIFRNEWPGFYDRIGLDRSKFPKIYNTGDRIGHVSNEAAQLLGLSENTVVVAGTPDAFASAIATGICRPGDVASVLGTTIVTKAVAENVIHSQTGANHSHKFPGGYYLYSGASNVGGRCLNEAFDSERFRELDKEAEQILPGNVICYPLIGKGERSPFADPDAVGFAVDTLTGADLHWKENGSADWDKVGELRHYAALMEGVAFTERLGYELSEEDGCRIGDCIFCSGGGAKSGTWLKIRASVLNKTLIVPEVVDAAMGMAMIASLEYHGTLENAAAQMVRIKTKTEPDKKLAALYDKLYKQFKNECCLRYTIKQNG